MGFLIAALLWRSESGGLVPQKKNLLVFTLAFLHSTRCPKMAEEIPSSHSSPSALYEMSSLTWEADAGKDSCKPRSQTSFPGTLSLDSTRKQGQIY